jgi:hypothetical protein
VRAHGLNNWNDLRIGLEWADVTPAAAISSIELQSSTEAAGPYASAAGQSLDSANNVFTAPKSGEMQFYRISGPTAATITRIHISANSVIITYN